MHNGSNENKLTAYVNFLVTKMVPKSISLEKIKTETDISLVAVKTALLSGKWYNNPIFETYRRFQNELTDNEGIILSEIGKVTKVSLEIGHEGHLSVEKCNGLLRRKVYWVTMNTDIESHIEKYPGCQANLLMTTPEPIKMSILPKHVCDKLSMDFFGPLQSGEYLFVLEDIYSRYLFVNITKTTTH